LKESQRELDEVKRAELKSEFEAGLSRQGEEELEAIRKAAQDGMRKRMREAREKLKLSIVEENRQLKLENAKLVAENEKLKRD